MKYMCFTERRSRIWSTVPTPWRTSKKDEKLFFLFKKVADLPPLDRIEAKQIVTSFLEQRRGR